MNNGLAKLKKFAQERKQLLVGCGLGAVLATVLVKKDKVNMYPSSIGPGSDPAALVAYFDDGTYRMYVDKNYKYED